MSLINTVIKPFKATAYVNGKFETVTDANLKGQWSVLTQCLLARAVLKLRVFRETATLNRSGWLKFETVNDEPGEQTRIRRRPDAPSALAARVLHHPSYQLTKPDTLMGRQLRHQRRFRHPRLGVDFEADHLARTIGRVVISKVHAAHTATA